MPNSCECDSALRHAGAVGRLRGQKIGAEFIRDQQMRIERGRDSKQRRQQIKVVAPS